MKGNVLVGVVRNAEQLGANLENLFYHIPAGNVPKERLPVDFVALYLSQSSFGEGGIGYVGEVVSAEKVRRGSILELPTDDPEQMYYRFGVARWTRLEPVMPVDGRIMVCAYTTLDALFCGKAALPIERREGRERDEESGRQFMTQEEQSRVVTTVATVTASQLADRINGSLGRFCLRVTKEDISDWLFENGLLCEQENSTGKCFRVPSRAGYGLGIVTVEKYTEDERCYRVIKYREEAQKFVIRHINAIMK